MTASRISAKTGDAFQYGGPHLCAGGEFPDARRQGAICRRCDLPAAGKRQPGVFHVSTRRGKQFNTLIYAEIDPLNGAPRDAVLMNADDAARLHLRTGDPIALVNDLGRYEGRVFLAPIAPGNLQVHWPEGNVIIRRGVVDTRRRRAGLQRQRARREIMSDAPSRTAASAALPRRKIKRAT